MSSPPPSTTSNEKQPPQTPESIARGLQNIVNAVKEMSEVADKRASTFLLGLGGTLLALAFLFKMKPFGLSFAEMQPSEFISVLVVCLVCLLAGAFVRMWQERLTNDHELRKLKAALWYSKESQAASLDAVAKAAELAAEPTKKALEAAPRGSGG